MKSAARSDVRIKIQETRLKMAAKDRGNVPAIVRAVMEANGLRFRRDRRISAMLFSLALNPLIRAMVKENGKLGGGVEQGLLDLWPNGQRQVVADIDEQSAFVPSKGAFVEFDPALWTAEQADEAGEYLIAKGTDTIKRGELLKNLAVLMRKAAPPARQSAG